LDLTKVATSMEVLQLDNLKLHCCSKVSNLLLSLLEGKRFALVCETVQNEFAKKQINIRDCMQENILKILKWNLLGAT